MNPLDLLAQPLWQHGTWALAHFLWQGCAVALVYVALLRVIEWRGAEARYALGLVAMSVMALCVPATFFWLTVTMPANASTAAFGGTASEAAPLISAADAFASQDSLIVASEPWGDRFERWMAAAQPWLAAAWLAGVSCFGLRLLVSFAGVAWLAESTRELPGDLARVARRVARRLGLEGPADVFLSDRVSQATAIGFLRPLVLLPAAWAVQLDVATLEAVIAHELAHVRRWDLWVNLLQRCVETLLFYHPAVWWLSSQVRAEREMCCDEMAAEAAGDRAGYVAALVEVAQVQVAPQQAAACAPLLGAGMGGDDMALLQRVRYVLGLSAEGENGRWWPVGLAALALPAVVWIATIGLGGTTVAEDGERPKEGEKVKEGDRPKEGERVKEGGGVKEGARKEEPRKEGDKPKEGDRPKEGARKEGERKEEPRKEGAGKEGDRARAELSALEARAREAIANTKTDEEARAIKAKFAAQAKEIMARTKAGAEGLKVRPDNPAREGGGHEQELMAIIAQLKSEVARLRAEVSELRGQKGGGDRKPEVRKEGGDRKPDLRKEGDGDRKPEPRKEGEGDRKPEVKKDGGDRKPEARKGGEEDR